MSSATDRIAILLGLLLLASPACSGDDTTGGPPDASPGSGGSTGTGGSAGTGGGATNTGGAPGSGGSTGTGGGSAGTGGSTGRGGSTGTGGAMGTGGSTGAGGSTGRGGAAGTGGAMMRDAAADARPRDAAVDVRQFDATPDCIAGDPQQPLEVAVVYRTTASFMPIPVAPAQAQLIQAPQGGQVLFVGVRARNIAGCNVTIRTALVDTGTGAVASLESRPITLEMGTDGWLQPRLPTSMSNYSNLPACPRANLTRPIENQTYQLQVILTDAQGRTNQTSTNIVPTCGTTANSTLCHCQCAQNYVQGMACP